MTRYNDLMVELVKDQHHWENFRAQAVRVIDMLQRIVDIFNADIKKYEIPFKSIKWTYGVDGKVIGAMGGLPCIKFNEVFTEWRAQTGCSANFFVKTRDGRYVEKLIILDITKSLYANTDTTDFDLQKIMDDAVHSVK